MADEGVPAVAVDGISKTFPGQRALDGVSLTVERATVHALLGHNGSGKSTLIKILDGFHEPDPGGSIRINGTLIERDRAAAAHRLGLRCVHQHLGLIDEFNAIENFGLTDGYPTTGGRIDWGVARKRVEALLDRIGVQMDLKKPVGECAPVERTALAVARAVSDLADAERGCLLLDEPTAALDHNEVEHLFAIVRQLTSQGVSVIYVTHRLDEVFTIADDVTTLRGGHVVHAGRVADLSRQRLINDITGSVAKPEGSPRRDRPARGPSVLRASELRAVELDGVSFDVAAGEIVGVAGLLGSGRSELPYVLSGRGDGFDGVVTVTDPEGGASADKRTQIALVPSNRLGEAAVADFSIRENMTLADLRPFRAGGLLRRGRENAFVKRWGELFEIRPVDPERNFVTLSGGNQQKVVLAKWLGVEPKVLLLDEPTAGVDVGARAKIYTLLREQSDQGLAIVACSSDLDELVELADRVLVLRDGRIVAELAGDDINAATMMRAMTEGEEDHVR